MIPDLTPIAKTSFGPDVTSPSAIEEFSLCPRKWAWKRIGKLSPPPGAGAALGTDLHAQAETYLAGGTIDYTRPSGPILAQGLGLLPQPLTPGLQIEGEFWVRHQPTGIVFMGKKDVQIPGIYREGAYTIPGYEDDAGIPLVLDHKTSKNIHRYSKSPEDLRSDPQGVIYGAALMAEESADVVDLAWVYYQTQGTPKTKRTHLRLVDDSGFRDQWARILGVAEKVVECARRDKRPTGATPAEIGDETSAYIVSRYLPNTDACQAFGGCPYLARCVDIDGVERLFGKDDGNMDIDDLFADLAGRKGAAVVAEEPVRVNPPEQAKVLAPAAAPSSPSSPSSPAALDDLLGFSAPSSPATPGPPAFVHEPGPPSVVDAPPAKKPRGRPKKVATQAAEEPAPATERAPAAPEPDEVDEAQDDRPIEVLYINCVPFSRPATHLDRILTEVRAQIRLEHKVPDYRTIEFGRGYGVLIQALEDHIRELSAATETGAIAGIVVDTSTPEGRDLTSALVGLSQTVIRGF